MLRQPSVLSAALRTPVLGLPYERIMLLAGVVMLNLLVTSIVFGQSGLTDDNVLYVSTTDMSIEGAFVPPSNWPMEVRLPAGTRVDKLVFDGDKVEVNLSEGILAVLSEATITDLFDEFRGLFYDSPKIHSVRLMCNGKLLASYLEPVKSYATPSVSLDPKSILGGIGAAATQGLGGTSITLGPSHGRVWHNVDLYWYWQREYNMCGWGEEVSEEFNSIRLVQFVNQYLIQDGATVHVCRQLDESDCCFTDPPYSETQAWWRMASRYWLEHIGVPSTVWNTGGLYDVNDDIRARPLYADYVGSDIYISHHANSNGGTASGTVVFYDSKMEHPQHEANSLALAEKVFTHIMDAIHTYYDPSFYDGRGWQDSSGAYGEIRIPNQPACLIELAFYNNCNLDALYLKDNWFRSLTGWALYQAVCDYFGRTPSWDVYSCELVSETIPSQMDIGHSYSVSITYRNRGVNWDSAHNFKLGAVGDSDPFTGFNRVALSGEILPGETYTFNFTMLAPVSPGLYTTDWQMIREGHTWFGPTVSKQVSVIGQPGDFDDDDDVDLHDFGVFQTCLTGTGNPQGDPDCTMAKLEGGDADVDDQDLNKFLGCMSGTDIPGDPDCLD